MKKFLSIVLVLLFCLSVTACSNKETNTDSEKEITYSNLTEKKSIDTLSSLLKESGVKNENIDKIISSIKNYNSVIGSDLMTDEGTINPAAPIPEYDVVKIDELWLNKYDMFIGYNCRLTAFELMKNFITIKDTTNSNPSSLFMDMDALDYSEDDYFTDEEFEKFEAMYSTIYTNSSTDFNEQYKVQKEYWDSIGVEFNNGDDISLISVYVHNHYSDTDNELIVGHTGVLMNNDGEYIFFEKLSFQLPYQMIRFNSKQELKDYLMTAYDVDTTGENAKPFILENGTLL